MRTDRSDVENDVEAAAVALCDRLCLNNDLYQQYLSDASAVVAKYVPDARIQSAVQAEVTKRLDSARLAVHWENSIACACRDVAYEIPETKHRGL